jgi:hypothetical protein
MAGKPIVIKGEIYDGSLSIGGGPIIPGPGEPPLGIWGPPGPWPKPPIYIPGPPPNGGEKPPEGWTPPTDAHPEHPIYIPVLPPEETPKPPPGMLVPPTATSSKGAK